MKSKRSLVMLLMLAIAIFSVVPALTVSAQDSLIESLCLVTDKGKVNDGTFNQFAHDGASKAADEFGLNYDYIETVAETDYAKNIDTCVSEGYQAIVTVGFLIADATKAAAIANPDIYFIGVDQFVGPDADGNAAPSNYVGLQFREDQGGFLAGALAAQMTKSGIIAGVYGIDIPPVRKFRNGFENGAKFINPDITILGTYNDSFIEPDTGGANAKQFIGEGADVILGAGGPTGTGGILTAAADGVYVIGVDQDEYNTSFGGGTSPGADKIITSAMKRVDQAVYLAVEALVEGGADFPGGTNLILSAENAGIGYAPKHDSDVSDEITAKMDEILIGLKNNWVATGVDTVTGDLLPPPPTVAELQAALDTAETLKTQLTDAQTQLADAQLAAETAQAASNNTTPTVLAILAAGVLLGAGAFLGLRRRK
ncbi:MAG: BMP family ABC transporter substrate-binding protein [Chloroflexi bacterium]|nr:BMP family ABC transporter substrate-binding protein [Chloroflexota bacterium]MCC6897199.1 BMP family ABC transporter substrate-binding protein [Anaerolineae bacterium]